MAENSRHAAGVLLVRADGSVLLQLRDEHAPSDPHRWGIPGGRAEPDEDPAAAALRELLEETGLCPSGPLLLFWSGTTADRQFTAHVFYAASTATAADVMVGEGAAMAFIPGTDIMRMDLAANAAPVLRSFLHSHQYRDLLTPPAAPNAMG